MWPFRRKPDTLSLEILTDAWDCKTATDHALETSFHHINDGSAELIAVYDQWRAASDDLEWAYARLRDIHQQGAGVPRDVAIRYHTVGNAYVRLSHQLQGLLERKVRL